MDSKTVNNGLEPAADTNSAFKELDGRQIKISKSSTALNRKVQKRKLWNFKNLISTKKVGRRIPQLRKILEKSDKSCFLTQDSEKTTPSGSIAPLATIEEMISEAKDLYSQQQDLAERLAEVMRHSNQVPTNYVLSQLENVKARKYYDDNISHLT